MGSMSVPAIPLATEATCSRLNQIDRLRSIGAGGHVSLPVLAVCGDQSAGKSSVLERLTGIPFPRKHGLCTRCVTEIVLRHADQPLEIKVTIRPHISRDPETRKALEDFTQTFSASDGFDLPVVIGKAGKLMGLKGYGNAQGAPFAPDILHIQVTGLTGLHLTIVDLPGLISVPNDEQTQQDIESVHRIADACLEKPRTIILAVIQAGNDIANQSIAQKGKTFDPEGIRTVGIITKPDLINQGTEPEMIRLASNQGSVKLNLGSEAVDCLEKGFFAQPCWEGHDPDRVGAGPLKEFLRNLLHTHIEREIPKIKDELRQKLANTESQISNLGKPRNTVENIRGFLVESSALVHRFARSASLGLYLGANTAFFAGDTRLRAMIHRANVSFAEEMRLRGEKRATAGQAVLNGGQISVSQREMMDWVKEVYFRTRGLEIPGNYNHSLLAELYQTQSSRWFAIATTHLNKVAAMEQAWWKHAIATAIRDEDLQGSITEMCLKKSRRPPVTYNHYYSDNIQKARIDSQVGVVQSALNKNTWKDKQGHTLTNTNDVISAVKSSITLNLDDHACEEALICMQAYYKVALKTFVDNVCRQVIERHIMAPFPGNFTPTTVSQMPDDELLRIGREPAEKHELRQKLGGRAETMRKALHELDMNP